MSCVTRPFYGLLERNDPGRKPPFLFNRLMRGPATPMSKIRSNWIGSNANLLLECLRLNADALDGKQESDDPNSESPGADRSRFDSARRIENVCTHEFSDSERKPGRCYPFLHKLAGDSLDCKNQFEQVEKSTTHLTSPPTPCKDGAIGGSLFRTSTNSCSEINCADSSMVDSKAKNEIQHSFSNDLIAGQMNMYIQEFQVANDKHDDESCKDKAIPVKGLQILRCSYDEESLDDGDVINRDCISVESAHTVCRDRDLFSGIEHYNPAAKVPVVEDVPKHACKTNDKLKVEGGEQVVEEESQLIQCDDDAIEGLRNSDSQEDKKLPFFSLYKEDTWSEDAVGSNHMRRFPPPISILANTSRPDVPRHMPRVFWRAVKKDGRFVLQEAQARPQEFFQAIREDGRLRLQLVRPDGNSASMQVEKATKGTEKEKVTEKMINKTSNHFGKGRENWKNLTQCRTNGDYEPLHSV